MTNLECRHQGQQFYTSSEVQSGGRKAKAQAYLPGCSRDYMGSSQNKGPVLVPLNIKCRDVIYSQKGHIILRTTHIREIVGDTAGDDLSGIISRDIHS